MEETAAADETEQFGSDYGLDDMAGDVAGSGDEEAARWDEAVGEAADEWPAPASTDGQDARASAKQLAAQRRWEDLVREESAAREHGAGLGLALPETQTPPGYRDEPHEAAVSSHDVLEGGAAAGASGGVVTRQDCGAEDNGAGVGATQPFATDGADDGGSGHGSDGSDGTEVADDDDDEEQLPCSQAELPWRRAPSKQTSAPDQVTPTPTSTPTPTLTRTLT